MIASASSSSSSSEFGDLSVREEVTCSESALAERSEARADSARSLTRSTMGEVLGDNGEGITRARDGTCVGIGLAREALMSLSASSRVTVGEAVGMSKVVTPSAQLRVRRAMTTALVRAAGFGWQKR